MKFNLFFFKDFTPKKLAYIFMIFGLLFTFFAFNPIAGVFAGNFKLNQKIDLAENVVINFDSVGLGDIVERLGIERNIPFGNISIRFYSICILLGVIAGYILTLYLAKLQFVAGTIIDRLIIGLIIFGFLGARLFFVIFNWSTFAENPVTVFTEIPNGGLAIFGMMIVGIGFIWLYCTRYKFSFYEFLDFIAPGVLLGQVIGRFGNFFNYEGYGPETSVFWKMFVPETANYYANVNARYFHPTFIYEIIPNFLLLIFLLYNYQKLTEKRSGFVFAIYAIGYGVIRFLTEFLRLDALRLYLPGFFRFNLPFLGTVEYFYASQVVAIALLIFGITIIYRRRKIIYFKKSMQEFSIS